MADEIRMPNYYHDNCDGECWAYEPYYVPIGSIDDGGWEICYHKWICKKWGKTGTLCGSDYHEKEVVSDA